jgi:prepilin-type N-terminal cleavage/methylation domain-containing protein
MKKQQKGFSLIELLIVVAIILIIAAIAIPNLLRSKMAANESSAVGSMRTINTAEVTYFTAYPNTGYSADVLSLGGVPATCATTATTGAACLIDNVLALATGAGTAKSGYFFTYALTGAAGGINTAYTLNGQPANAGTTGQRFFFTDQTGVIRYGLTGAATAASSAIQ